MVSHFSQFMCTLSLLSHLYLYNEMDLYIIRCTIFVKTFYYFSSITFRDFITTHAAAGCSHENDHLLCASRDRNESFDYRPSFLFTEGLVEGLGMRLTVGALKSLTTARASTSLQCYITISWLVEALAVVRAFRAPTVSLIPRPSVRPPVRRQEGLDICGSPRWK